MIRHATILATLFVMLIGSIGVPVSLHACSMEDGGPQVGESCRMCSRHTSHAACGREKQGSAKKSRGCCQTGKVLQHIDNARLTHTGIDVVAPYCALPLFPPYSDLALLVSRTLDRCVDLPPPGLARIGAVTWLRTCRLLI